MRSLRFIVFLGLIFATLIACGKSSVDARKELTQLGIPYSEPAFVASAEKGDLAAVKLFILANMDPNVQQGAALTGAILRNQREVADYLFNNGANADSKGRALIAIAGNKDIGLITYLFDKGADVNYQSVQVIFNPFAAGNVSKIVTTALTSALKEKNVRNAKIFLDKGAKGDACDLVEAARIGDVEIIKRVLDTGVDINGKCLRNSALSSTGDIALRKWLLEHGASVNTLDEMGNSLIFYASKYPRTPAELDNLKLLIRYKPDLSLGNNPVTVVDLIRIGKRMNDNELIEMVTKTYIPGGQL